MKILVCCKFIRDDNELTVNPDRSINLDSAPWMISSYDLNAIEAAMKLSSSVEGSTVEVISAAGEVLDNTKMRKAVLSRGPSKLYGVKVEECGDLYSTAALLSRAIQPGGRCPTSSSAERGAATCTLRHLEICWPLFWMYPRLML